VETEDEAAELLGIAGMYDPLKDEIYLFNTGGRVSAASVALEEAGHSRQRMDYVDAQKRVETLRTALVKWHPRASITLDWTEDHRVYNLLKDDYPGAHADLDHTWEKRRDDTKDLGFNLGNRTFSAEQREWLAAMHAITTYLITVIDDYFASVRYASFDEVLQRVEDWLKKQPPASKLAEQQKGQLLQAGKQGDQRDQVGKQGLKLVQPGDDSVVQVLVSIVEHLGDRGAGLGRMNVDYPWRIIANDVIRLEGSESADF
jgi:hypothetical protein